MATKCLNKNKISYERKVSKVIPFKHKQNSTTQVNKDIPNINFNDILLDEELPIVNVKRIKNNHKLGKFD